MFHYAVLAKTNPDNSDKPDVNKDYRTHCLALFVEKRDADKWAKKIQKDVRRYRSSVPWDMNGLKIEKVFWANDRVTILRTLQQMEYIQDTYSYVSREEIRSGGHSEDYTLSYCITYRDFYSDQQRIFKPEDGEENRFDCQLDAHIYAVTQDVMNICPDWQIELILEASGLVLSLNNNRLIN